MTITELISRIRAYRLYRGWSILRLGTEAGIGESTIRKMDRPEWNPTREVIARLEAIIPARYDHTKIEQPLEVEAIGNSEKAA